jgi:hypothetical protein
MRYGFFFAKQILQISRLTEHYIQSESPRIHKLIKRITLECTKEWPEITGPFFMKMPGMFIYRIVALIASARAGFT